MSSIESKINRINSHFLGNKRIVFMGRMEHVKQMILWARGKNYQVEAIIDNDIMKQGLIVENIEVFLPKDKLLPYSEEYYIIIYSPKYWEDIVGQLGKYGYVEGKNIYVVDKPTAIGNLELIRKGYVLYKGLQKEFGKDVQVFWANCPLGDYYLLCLFFLQYCEVNNIKNYVMVGTSLGINKLSPMFGIDNTKRLSDEESEALVCAWRFLGDNRIRLKPLTIWQGSFRFNPCITRQLGKFSFLDTFRYMIYNLPEGIEPRYPVRANRQDAVCEFFEAKKLQKGRTVILCPFSYSLESLSNKFWICLAEKLIDAKFSVAVNIGGKEENFIPNTITMSMDFVEILDAMECAGTVVGMRSGFFDITSQADCRRIVIYPKNGTQKSSWNPTGVGFVGLKRMGLCEDAYEWEKEEEHVLIDRIIEVLTE